MTKSLPQKKSFLPVSVAVGSNFIEYYDYTIYAFFVAAIAKTFFVQSDPGVALMKSWWIFVLGSVAKSLGAYVFGRIGDTIGRRWCLRWNIFGIGVTTLLMAVAPGYQTAGEFFAPFILLVLRFLQGFFYGGEVDGIRIYILETVGQKKPCFANSLSSLSSTLGVAFAGVVASSLDAESWRLGFALGGFGSLLIFLMRAFLPETPSFLREQEVSKSLEKPSEGPSFFKLVLEHKHIFIAIIGLSACVSGGYYFMMLFGPSLWSDLMGIMTKSDARSLTNQALWTYTLLLPCVGWLADRTSVKKIFLAGLIGLIGVSFLFLIYPAEDLLKTNICLVAFALALSFVNVTTYVLVIERVPVRRRYQIISVAHALGSSLLASTVPFIGSILWIKTQNFLILAFYLFFLVSLGLIGWLLMRSLKRVPV